MRYITLLKYEKKSKEGRLKVDEVVKMFSKDIYDDKFLIDKKIVVSIAKIVGIIDPVVYYGLENKLYIEYEEYESGVRRAAEPIQKGNKNYYDVYGNPEKEVENLYNFCLWIRETYKNN